MLKDCEKHVADFYDILRQRGYLWDINQHHAYFKYTQPLNGFQIKAYWENFIEAHRTKKSAIERIDCYVHMPFCRSKCMYCAFPSWDSRSRNISSYIEYLIAQFEFFTQTFEGVRLRNLYLGGGTPSMLTARQLGKLLSQLFAKFNFQRNTQMTSECNPHNVAPGYLRVLRDFNFNRVSFGVQSLNKRTLKINKRGYQEYAKIKQAILLAKKTGFKDINVDLILGLAGDSLDDFKKNFSEIASLRPYNIVVYGLMPPHDRYFKTLLGMGRKKYYMKHYLGLVKDAVEIMRSLGEQYGYIPDSLDPCRWHWGFRYKECLDFHVVNTYTGEFADCTLGFGCYSRSHINGVLEYRQNIYHKTFNPYENIYMGERFNKNIEMLKFILNHMDRTSRIPLELFRKTFGIRLEEVFPQSLACLRQCGKMKAESGQLVFSFASPEEKYVYVLFFFRQLGLA